MRKYDFVCRRLQKHPKQVEITKQSRKSSAKELKKEKNINKVIIDFEG